MDCSACHTCLRMPRYAMPYQDATPQAREGGLVPHHDHTTSYPTTHIIMQRATLRVYYTTWLSLTTLATLSRVLRPALHSPYSFCPIDWGFVLTRLPTYLSISHYHHHRICFGTHFFCYILHVFVFVFVFCILSCLRDYTLHS